MQLSKNLTAGLANSLWSALVGLALVPFYLRYLGVDGYALIAFAATTQGILQILDLGLAPTVNREVALRSTGLDFAPVRSLTHSAAIIYWAMAIAIAGGMAALASTVATHWLQSDSLSRGAITAAVMLLGLMIGCRWPSGLYQAALIGAQRQTISSAVNIVATTLGALGIVVVLAFVSPTIQAYFLWQAAVGLLFSWVLRSYAWRVLGNHGAARFSVNSLRPVAGFATGMGAVTAAGILLAYLDKAMLSKLLPLENFGHYMLAWTMVSILYVLISPTFNALYPRFSALFGQRQNDELYLLYRLSTKLTCTTIFPLAAVIASFPKELLYVWTGSAAIASAAAPIAVFLVVGTSLNCVMHLPYALQLACGGVWLSFKIAIGLIVIFVPLIIFLTTSYGSIGGAAAWAALNILYTFVGSWMTHRFFIRRGWQEWLVQDLGVPMALSVVVVISGRVVFSMVPQMEREPYLMLTGGAALGLVAFLLCLALSPRTPTKLSVAHALRNLSSMVGPP